MDKYALAYELVDNLIVMRLRGLWTHDDFAAFQRDTALLFRRVSPDRPWFELVDLRQHAVQSSSVAAAIAGLAGMENPPAKNAVILTGQALQALQAKRIAPFPNTRFFTNEADARAWIRTRGDAAGD